MGNCVNCFFQGDTNTDENGENHLFCLVKGNWFRETASCENYREHAQVSNEIRSMFAVEIRREIDEDARLKKVVRSMWKMVIFTFIVSFASFFCIVKFLDKYIF
ncbi:MAG: hypothetical protein NTU66_01240 [Elusimicrobia bacterium]|nr:hypothetical protein [Elusimicrobiota bacterium]